MPELYPIDLDLRVEMQTSHHVGTGRAAGLTDRTIRRDAGGRPYLPASALKGALRESAERLVGRIDRTVGELGLGGEAQYGRRYRAGRVTESRCYAPRPEEMCLGAKACVVCRVFGNVHTGKRLRVADARRPEGDLERSLLAAIRNGGDKKGRSFASSEHETVTRLRMDRRRRGASDGGLFTSEYARPAHFSSRLTGHIPATPLRSGEELGPENPPVELIFLVGAIGLTEAVGAEKSTGHGRCRIELAGGKDAISFAGHTFELETLIDELPNTIWEQG